ncbi:hypothetical protein NP493_829g01027 [Ridgeia piscesae]|uniref:Uncharacterized protein n=1 Tax=Ridgeia piscesae TaxID=27915 RepID=A0AAD9KM31_RIDPI|nr:hypothetical protein NP493_829g01027 [Ridgeia piscesae]
MTLELQLHPAVLSLSTYRAATVTASPSNSSPLLACRALTTDQLKRLTFEQKKAVTTDQIKALNADQKEALTGITAQTFYGAGSLDALSAPVHSPRSIGCPLTPVTVTVVAVGVACALLRL